MKAMSSSTNKSVTMLLRQLVINRYAEALQKHSKLQTILEDAGVALVKAAKAAETDREQLEKLDIEELADLITTVKLLTNPDFRQAMTKKDVGIDPTSAEDLFKMLDMIPSDMSKDMPKAARDFIRAVATTSKSTRSKELASLKLLVGPSSSQRDAALAELKKVAQNVVKALEALKAKATA